MKEGRSVLKEYVHVANWTQSHQRDFAGGLVYT